MLKPQILSLSGHGFGLLGQIFSSASFPVFQALDEIFCPALLGL